MKAVGITRLFLQDVVYTPDPRSSRGGIALYQGPAARLSWIGRRYPTVDRLMAAAASVGGLKVVLPTVYAPEGTHTKCDAGRYAALLTKTAQVSAQLWAGYRRNPAFGGWLVSQEVDDTTTPSCPTAAFVAATGRYYGAVASHLRAKDRRQPVYLAPSTSASLPIADFESLWRTLLSRAPAASHVLLQDGVGQGRTDLGVDVPQYSAAMRRVAGATHKSFGVIVELFDQPASHRTGRHEVATLARLTRQLDLAGRQTRELSGFPWFAFTSRYDKGVQLGVDYARYAAAARARRSARPAG